MAKAEPRSITRRSLLSGAAAAVPAAVMPAAIVTVPAAAVAAAPAISDPIFTAIEAHVRAFAEFDVVLDDLAAAEQVAWHAPRGKRRAANKRLAEARAAERRFGDLESDAVERLVAIVPQTLEGALAVLRYMRERFERGMCDEDECVALLESIEGCLHMRLAAAS